MKDLSYNEYRKILSHYKSTKYHNQTIKHILEKPLYKGIAHYKKNKVENKELALI